VVAEWASLVWQGQGGDNGKAQAYGSGAGKPQGGAGKAQKALTQ